MNLRDLRYLVAVADYGHFGRAAEACHVSQPTLSTQLRKLEDYLGAILIERTSRSVTLTPAGKDVVARARAICAETEAILALTRAARGPLEGPLNLGVIPTLGPYLLPWFISEIRTSFPRLQLVVHEDFTHNILERLRAYRMDAAFLALPVDADDVDCLPLFEEPFWFACPAGHPLAEVQGVTEADLADQPLLLLAEGHCLRGQALEACGRKRIDEEAPDDFRASSLETLCQLVAAGLGCTLVPGLAATRLAEFAGPIAIKPMVSRKAYRSIGLVWRRGYSRSKELVQLAQVIRESPPAGTVRRHRANAA